MEDVPVRIKLAALWTSVMFCYIYADYFEMYALTSLVVWYAWRWRS